MFTCILNIAFLIDVFTICCFFAGHTLSDSYIVWDLNEGNLLWIDRHCLHIMIPQSLQHTVTLDISHRLQMTSGSSRLVFAV